jgi:hypothetical protein
MRAHGTVDANRYAVVALAQGCFSTIARLQAIEQASAYYQVVLRRVSAWSP